jgi:hypothetical protein
MFALNTDLQGAIVGIGDGNGRQQSLSVRMLRIAKQGLGGGCLDNLTQIHHCDAMTDVTNHVQIVRNKDDTDAEPLTETFEQIYDLSLDGYIEGRNRLVGDQNLWFERQGARDADPLPLSAAKRMRQPILQTRREAYHLQQAVRTIVPFGRRHAWCMDKKNFVQHLSDRHPGI